MRHAITRMRATLDNLEIGIRSGFPLGSDMAQSVTGTAVEIALLIAKADAFALAAEDRE
jgi:hypothetical protein